jgi:nicotinamidase-related amidase
MNAKETAILLIEFQNEWLSPEGSLHFVIQEQLEKKRLVVKTEYLLQEARRKGVTIVHVPLSFTQDYREVSRDATALASIIKENKRFQQNNYGAEIYSMFTPTSSDLVAEGRKGISGFAGSNLDHLLRARGIRHVAVAGFVTEVCVESTIRDAYDRGYHCTLLSDCTAAHSNEDQTYVEKTIMPYFGNVLTSKELIDQVG